MPCRQVRGSGVYEVLSSRHLEKMMTQTTDTGTARNTELVVKFLELIDRHQFDEAEPFLSSDFHLYFSGQQTDKAQTMTLIRGVYQSFADFKHEVQEVLAVDDRVILRIIDRATHTGEFEGIPATGCQIKIGQISILRVVDDKIVEIREEADMLGLMQQLGAIPAQTS